ncbi:MAG: hypothetical protein MI863_20685 [Desulfobacterales bacterium]|nr:hypothetical protein [Desulfobacterales bacterium]
MPNKPTDQPVSMEIAALSKLIDSLNMIEAGFHGAIHTLAKSGSMHTDLYKVLCKERSEIESLKNKLKPAVYL